MFLFILNLHLVRNINNKITNIYYSKNFFVNLCDAHTFLNPQIKFQNLAHQCLELQITTKIFMSDIFPLEFVSNNNRRQYYSKKRVTIDNI